MALFLSLSINEASERRPTPRVNIVNHTRQAGNVLKGVVAQHAVPVRCPQIASRAAVLRHFAGSPRWLAWLDREHNACNTAVQLRSSW